MKPRSPSQITILSWACNLKQLPATTPYPRPAAVIVEGGRVRANADPQLTAQPLSARPRILQDFLRLAGGGRGYEERVRSFVLNHGLLRFAWFRSRLEPNHWVSQSVDHYQELAEVVSVALRLRHLGVTVKGPKGSGQLLVTSEELEKLSTFVHQNSGPEIGTIARLIVERVTSLSVPVPESPSERQAWVDARLKWPAALYNTMVSAGERRTAIDRPALEVIQGNRLGLVWPGSAAAALSNAFRAVLEREYQRVGCSFCGRLVRRMRAPRDGAKYHSCRRPECERARGRMSMRESRALRRSQ